MFASIPDGYKLVKIGEDGGGGLKGLFGKDKKDKKDKKGKSGKSWEEYKNSRRYQQRQEKINAIKGGSNFSPVNEALNSKGLEQFAFYENPAAGGETVIMEVPVPVGAGAGAPPTAEGSVPTSQGGGKSSSPFMVLYRGDG